MFEQNWRHGMQNAAAEIDNTFSEMVTITPTSRAPNQMAKLDPTLRPATVCACFSWRSEMAFNNRDSRSLSSSTVEAAPLISTRKPVFSFSFGVLPYALKQGYRIERLCDGSIFEVKDAKSDGVSRVQAEVAQLGLEPADYVGAGS
jgi:hypothetical protein